MSGNVRAVPAADLEPIIDWLNDAPDCGCVNDVDRCHSHVAAAMLRGLRPDVMAVVPW